MAVKITKVINTSNILQTIWNHQGISRIDISRLLRLDKSTITVIVSRLLEKNWVFELPEGDVGPRGGRKPVKLRLNKNFGCIAGIDIHAHYCSALMINMEGEILCRVHRDLKVDAGNFFTVIEETLEALKGECRTKAPLLGLGIGISGVVDYEGGVILQSNPLEMDHFPVVDELSRRLNIPVYIDNDANVCCRGETAFFRQQRLESYMFVLVKFLGSGRFGSNAKGVGVGIGFVLNGDIYRGENYTAGEFRSIELHDRFGQFPMEDEQAFHIEENPETMDFFFDELARHLAFMVNVLNLNHLFVGGDIERYRSEFTPKLQRAIKMNWPYDKIHEHCEIHNASAGDSVVAYGAAGMMLNELFSREELIQSLYD